MVHHELEWRGDVPRHARDHVVSPRDVHRWLLHRLDSLAPGAIIDNTCASSISLAGRRPAMLRSSFVGSGNWAGRHRAGSSIRTPTGTARPFTSSELQMTTP